MLECMRVSTLAAVLLTTGCNLHAVNNEKGPINLAVDGERIGVAVGERGVDLLDWKTSARLAHADPGGASDSYDDVALAGGWLFALDADDGLLSVFDAKTLAVVQRDVEVPVGPYSGVAAAGGRVVVSGGTDAATVFRYDTAGRLTVERTVEGHRGKPEVALDREGRAMFFSTHFSDPVDGHEFGLSVATFDGRFVDALGLPGAGFTEGGGRPASFPIRAAITQERVLVAHGGGLSIVAYDGTLDLKLLTTLNLGIQAVDVTVEGSTAWVVGVSPSSVVEVDLTEPAAPKVRKRTPLSDPPSAIVASGDKLVIATGALEVVMLPR